MKWESIEKAPAIPRDLARAIEESYEPPSHRCKMGFDINNVWAFWLDKIEGKWKVTKFLLLPWPQ